MTGAVDRRLVLAGGAAMLVAGRGGAAASAPDPIAAIERRGGGRLGVYVRDPATGRTLAHRADARFLFASTFKALLAGMALARVDAGRERLDAVVRYDRSALIPNSPVTTAHVGEGRLGVGALCAAMTSVSDNAAANLLLRRFGGPAALTAFLRATGDRVTRSDRYETALGVRRGDLDTTTPHACATTLAALLWGEVLRPASRRQLRDWLVGNTVGDRRLRAGLPRAWTVGDRTGTSDGICNDVAFVEAGGRRLIVAAFHDAPGARIEDQERTLAAVGATVASWWRA